MQLSVRHTMMSVVGAWNVWYSAVEIQLQGNVQWFFWSHGKLLFGSRRDQLATYTYVSTFVHVRLRWYGIYVRLCRPMRMVGIHSLSGTCPRTWLPNIYIVKGTHWNLRLDDVSDLYLWDVYLYLADCRRSLTAAFVLASALNVFLVMGWNRLVVARIGSGLVLSCGYRCLWWLGWFWLWTVGMENYRGWIGFEYWGNILILQH